MKQIANNTIDIRTADTLQWGGLHDYIVDLDDDTYTVDASNALVYVYSNQEYAVVELWSDDIHISTESAEVNGIITETESHRETVSVDVDGLNKWFARIGWKVAEWHWLYRGIAEVRMVPANA